MVCAVMDFAMSKYCSKLLQYFMNSQKLIQLSKLGFDSDRMLLCPSSQLKPHFERLPSSKLKENLIGIDLGFLLLTMCY